MEEEEDDKTVAGGNCRVTSSPCNAVSKCNEGDEMFSTQSRRKSLLGLIPVKISTSNPWDLRLDTQCLNNSLSDSVVRNCNRMF